MANRQKFPRPVEREIARRAVNAIGEKCCEQCGATGVPLELHHRDMDAMKTAEAKKRKLTETDGEMRCAECHDPETARQRTVLAKVEAVEARHWLPRKRSRHFPPPAAKDRSVTKMFRRRPLFEDA
jgi:hypothetical protein